MSKLKFKVGNRVEIVKIIGSWVELTHFKVGYRGKITSITRGEEYNYNVRRQCGKEELFKAQELRLLKQHDTL